MSPQISGILMKIGIDRLETQFAIQCAPVIAGLKISNLFIVPSQKEAFIRELFQSSGLNCFFLSRNRGKTTFLLYSKEDAQAYLLQPEIWSLLHRFGYHSERLNDILSQLQRRYQKCILHQGTFPHELGLILGYPKEDVTGFIHNSGQNFLYCGYWKVYAHPEEKKKLFDKYELATKNIGEMILSGKTLQDIVESYRDERRSHE